MKYAYVITFACMTATATHAQTVNSETYSEEIIIESLDDPEYLLPLNDSPTFEESAVQEQAQTGRFGSVRALDRSTGALADFSLSSGETVSFGRIDIAMLECRYPSANPSGDAYIHLVVAEAGVNLFDGWMLASSPALSALDHARYDVWALRCSTD